MTIAAQPMLEISARSTVGSRVVLRAQGLRKAFGGQRVLDDLDLILHEGEVVLLRGENGSGKTTLLNILTGNLEPDTGTIEYLADSTPRSYSFPRRWWQELNPFDHFTPEFVAREGIGRTWQDVRLFGSQSLRDNIAVAKPGHSGENPLVALLAPARANSREGAFNSQADAMLARLGLAGREQSSGDMVSLGQSKRVAIARAVVAGAKILFLDEPLAGLDRKGITDVLTLLESLVREAKLTLVIVEHVFNFVHLHHLVNVHWMLESGRLEKNHAEPIPQIDSIDGIPVTIAAPSWFSQLAGSPEHVTSERLPRGATLTRTRRPDHWKPEAKPVLEIKGLIVNRGARSVIGLDEHGDPNGFDLTLHQGEIAILQAPNGWGKSTLFDALCGNAPIKRGTIAINGSTVESTPPWIRAQTGLAASPSAAKLFPSLKVSEVSRLSPHSSSTGSIPFASRTISSLSGGEKQRTLLRMALPDSGMPQLVLLDEPFAMLDDIATRQAVEAIIGTQPHHAILFLIPANHSFS
ncbi:MAG: ATP-binding cassette domain-containing protein [Verrucomicrobiaceae bacterium]|nr:ATP-binding cassette domain-containing protein [Verrucomicrobiaceae bacterium]